jgi:hypothetical protein
MPPLRGAGWVQAPPAINTPGPDSSEGVKPSIMIIYRMKHGITKSIQFFLITALK